MNWVHKMSDRHFGSFYHRKKTSHARILISMQSLAAHPNRSLNTLYWDIRLQNAQAILYNYGYNIIVLSHIFDFNSIYTALMFYAETKKWIKMSKTSKSTCIDVLMIKLSFLLSKYSIHYKILILGYCKVNKYLSTKNIW